MPNQTSSPGLLSTRLPDQIFATHKLTEREAPKLTVADKLEMIPTPSKLLQNWHPI